MLGNREKNLTYPESVPRTLLVGESSEKKLSTFAAAKRSDWPSVIITGLILFLALLPISEREMTATKAVVGIILFALTFPSLVSAFVNKNRIPGQVILLFFLIITILNILVAVKNDLSIIKWSRMAFCTYIFTATIFTASYYGTDAKKRHYMWITIIIFATIYSILRLMFAARYSIIESYEDRAIGFVLVSQVGLMLLFPTISQLSIRQIGIGLGLFFNTVAMALSGSRGNIVLIIVGAIYIFIFTYMSLLKRYLFVALAIIVTIYVTTTFVYERMEERFLSAYEGYDGSWLERMDEINSVKEIVLKDWESLLVGKGIGAPWLAQYKLTRKYAASGGILDRIRVGFPHSEFMAKLLFCGIIGFISYIFVFISIGQTFITAIRQSTRVSNDPYVQIRLHGALLVLIAIILWGTVNEMVHWSPNIFQGFALGLGLAEASEILRDRERPV